MAFFQLLLKARQLEKARLVYQDEKLRSIEISKGAKVHYTLAQKIRRKKIIFKRKFRDCLSRVTSCPEDSWFHRKAVLLRTEGTFENFILKSVMGFLGGIFLTYMFFMFFVFQLNFALSSATLLCSLFGIILTIGLAFSYRVRCVVFLLLPQFFSKRGRQALMAYAFILALTGPAKNTLHNTGVLSESLACGQEQLKEAVRSIVDLVKQPFYALRDAISKVLKTVKVVVKRIKQALLAIKRMVLSILRVVKAVFQWLGSVINICNKKLGTPFERCQRAFDGAVSDCYAKLGPIFGTVCNLAYVAGTLCYIVKPLDFICVLVSFLSDAIVGAVRKKIKKFTKHMKAMFYVKVKFEHSFHFETNKSRSLEDISTGIVTEIRSRTDRFLTVFDWMSFATSFFVLFMLLRVIHYRQKWLTNERFDNRYLTEDLRHIDLIRAKKDKETVLPLNPRERNKYIPLSSLTLIKVEKINLTKSAVFLFLTTFKLCIHMVADYSLYWVLSTIRYHGRFETKVQRTNAVGVYVSGNGYLAELYRSIVRAFSPLGTEMEMDTVPCLPDPVPPDLDKYTQIVSLIVFCWIMAVFEPYGLRLRHVVMTYYHPERAKQRAVWLYNHIIRSRGTFLKYARRQLRRKFGMTDGKAIEHVTLKERLFAMCPILNKFFNHKEKACLLCGTPEREGQLPHVKCSTPGCVGLFCTECFADLQNLCTICRSPVDYGDSSDISEEKDSSDDQQPTRRKARGDPRSKIIDEDTEETSIDKKEFTSEQSEVSHDPRKDEEKLIGHKTAPITDEFGDDSSTEYSQSYQDEEPREVRPTSHRRVPYKDVEAQRQHDDVTIQIFNEPLRGDATSGSESPTSCFVVRAHRRLRSRLKGKHCSRDCRDSSTSSSTSIADTESWSTEEIEEEEVLHIEIEDDSEDRAMLGAGGSKILRKKSGRMKKIVDALSRVSWLKKKAESINDRENGSKSMKSRQPSLMRKVVNMLQSTGPARPIRTYKRSRRSKSDGEQVEDLCSSSLSSGSFSNEEHERRALISPTDGSRSERADRSRRKKSKKEERRRRDYSDDYIYETSWESHRQRGGGDTPRNVRYAKDIDKDRYSRMVNAMSKDNKYYEINEKNLNKLSDTKSSSEAGRSDDAWNITGTEDKQGMSTIDEDSRELSTDNPTSDRSATDDYVDVTGLSGSPPDKALTRKRATKYVTDDEWQAATSGERKRRKRIMKRRLETKSRGPELFDPLAGLELYGVEALGGKRKKRRRFEEEPSVVDEIASKTETDVSESKSEKSDESKSSAETKTKSDEEKRDSATETSGTETHSSGRKSCRERRAIYREYRRRAKRPRKDECRRRRKSRRRRRRKDEDDRRKDEDDRRKDENDRRKDAEKRPKTSSPDSADTSTQHRTEPGRSCASQAQPEEWLRDEQRRLWEQMCAKMAEYSHRFGYPDGFCQPTPYFPYSGCGVPMYDPQQFRPRFQGHLCPRFSRPPFQPCGARVVAPVLKKFLPIFQRPDLVNELKEHDRAKLLRERNERGRRCECGQMTRDSAGRSSTRDQRSFSRNILSRPSIIPERTDVLPYQETESYKNVVDEYRRMTRPRSIDEVSPEEDNDQDRIEDNEESQRLISISKIADKSNEVKQIFPPESKRRSSAVAQITHKIVNVFKSNKWKSKKATNEAANEGIADSESWSEMSGSAIDASPAIRSGETTSAEETTDNNETTG